MPTNGSYVKFIAISRASFDLIVNKDVNTLYVVTESGSLLSLYSGATLVGTTTNHRHNEMVYYVSGSGGSAGNWLGTNSNIPYLYDGLTIRYYMNQAGADPVYLNINDYGNKQVYRYAGARLTTHIPAGSIITLTYRESENRWYNDGDYDSTDDYRLRWETNVTFGALTHGYQLLMEGIDGKYYPVTQGGSTANTNTISTAELKIGGKILLYDSSTDYSANAVGGAYYLYEAVYNSNMEYWNNRDSGWAVASRPFYIRGTINSNGNFVIDNSNYTNFLTQDLPTTDDGFLYVQIGLMYNTYDAFRLHADHPIYQFKEGKLRQYLPEHTHSQYLQSVTKTMIEAVLTGNITSHTHDNYLASITKAMVEAVLTGSITSHTHDAYLKTNPDGDGVVIVYDDSNPTIDGQSVGGGHKFGADGNVDNGYLYAKILFALGVTHSVNGYYVGSMNPAVGGTGIQVCDASGNLKDAGTLLTEKFLQLAGGTLIGDLKLIDTGNVYSPELWFKNNTYQMGIDFSNGRRLRFIDRDNNVSRTEIDLVTGDIYVAGNKVYHAGNKPSKADVGLSAVDNTSDVNKPVSTAQANAIGLKVDKSITIPNGTSLNSIVTSGFYRLGSGHTDVPSDNACSYGQLICSDGSDTTTQIIFAYNSPFMAFRSKSDGGGWTNWATVYSKQYKPSASDVGAYTIAQTDNAISTAIANIIDASPSALNTLNELAQALGDDPNFATTMTNALAGKIPTTHTVNSIINGTGLLKNNGSGGWSYDNNVYLTAITKALVEAVLTGNITTHTHSQYLTAVPNAQSPNTATELSNIIDLNLLVTAGFYYQTANADTTGMHYPTNEAGSLIIQKSAGQVTQMYITYSTGEVWTRSYYTSWSTWRKMWNSNDFSASNKTQWDTAYGWGNHASAGYLTAITKVMVEAVLTGSITSHTHSQYLTAITKAMIEAQLTGIITTHSHTVTKSDVGLGNVDNTADVNKYVAGVKETRASANLQFWQGTQAQYNALGTYPTGTIYIIVG